MRSHTGQHILRRLYGMNESDMIREVCSGQICQFLYVDNAFRSAIMPVGFVAGASVQQL